MMNIINKIKGFTKKHVKTVGVSSLMAITALSASSIPTYAAVSTGNTDLDTLITSMEGGLDFIKTGGLYIVGSVIMIAVIFMGSRWVYNMFRSWLSRAQ